MFEKSRDLLFPSFVFFYGFCESFIFSLVQAIQQLFLAFSFEILYGEIGVRPAKIDPVTHD